MDHNATYVNDKFIFNISDEENICSSYDENYIFYPWVQAIFICLYVIIFVVGVGGNMMVLYVILANKHMRTTINIYLVNLAASDIIMGLCSSFSPAQTFMGDCWIFGEALCRLVRPSIYVSIYMSTSTLTAIAVNRYRAVFYPFCTRTNSMTRTVFTILCMDIVAIVITLPCAMMVDLYTNDQGDMECYEMWPPGTEILETAYWGCMYWITQFILPFTIIVICYVRIVIRLRQRARSQPESRSLTQRQVEAGRTKRMNKMLIYMVVIFCVCWFPNSLIHLVDNITNLVSTKLNGWLEWKGYWVTFYTTHVIAMSSTCYNPFLYGFMNPAFRSEFVKLCPYFQNTDSVSRGHQDCKTDNENGQSGAEIKMEDVSPAATEQTEVDKEENSRRKSVDLL